MITLKRNPGDRILELGGGGNPLVVPKCMGGNDVNVDARVCQNAAGQQTTDFTANFDEPLPLQANEFDGCVTQFCLEHVSWRKVKQFLAEAYRVLKPGGKFVVVTANTEAQCKWIADNPNGWDGKDAFESFSCVLFGDQDYPENGHKSYLNPPLAIGLFQAAGFERVVVQPYGERSTDMVIEAVKPGTRPADSVEWGGMVCGSVGPNGVTCTLEKGHGGKHRAETK